MSGLQVAGDVGISRTEEIQAHSAWDTYGGMEAWLQQLGISAAQKPPFPLPILDEHSYANIEGEEYSKVCLRVDRWYEYIEDLQAQMEGQLLPVKNEMDIIGVDYREQLRAQIEAKTIDKISETRMKDMTKQLPRYRQLMLIEQNLEIALKRFDARLKSLERYAKGLSRQLTFRGQEIDLANKSGRQVRSYGR